MKEKIFSLFSAIFMAAAWVSLSCGEISAAAVQEVDSWTHLKEAISSESDPVIITLTSNINGTGSDILEIKEKKVTINGNGHSITKTSSGAKGGFLFIHGGGELTLADVTISGGGHGAKELSNPTIIVGDSASDTGTLNIQSGTTIHDCYGYYGGAIRACGGTVSIYEGSIIKDNYSDNSGGAIYADDAATINIFGGTVENNTASGYGGAIFTSSTIYLSGGSIRNNTAGLSGGGIFSTSSDRRSQGIIISEKPVVQHNKASESENNIYFDAESLLIKSPLSDEAYVGITPLTGSLGQIVAAGLDSYHITAADLSHIHHDRLLNGSSTQGITLDAPENKAVLGNADKNCELYFSTEKSIIHMLPGYTFKPDFRLFADGQAVSEQSELDKVEFICEQNPSGGEAPVVSIQKDGRVTATGTGFASVGMKYFNTTSSNTITFVVSGDVNFDGILDMEDAIALTEMIVKKTKPDIIDMADINGDGIINILDLSILAHHIR